jgi:hypothetical protein
MINLESIIVLASITYVANLIQKDVWASMTDVPDKGPVRFLEKQIIRYDRENNLENMATQTPNT